MKPQVREVHLEAETEARPPAAQWMQRRRTAWERGGQKCRHCATPIAFPQCHTDTSSNDPQNYTTNCLLPLCRRCYMLHAWPRHESMMAAAIADGVYRPIGARARPSGMTILAGWRARSRALTDDGRTKLTRCLPCPERPKPRSRRHHERNRTAHTFAHPRQTAPPTVSTGLSGNLGAAARPR